MKRVAILMLVAVPVVAACSSGPDLATEENVIRGLDGRWLKAAQARDAAGEAALFADDGVAYRQNVEPLVGPAAYQAYLTTFNADNPKVTRSWSTDAIRLAESGDLAIQTGAFEDTGLGPNGDGEDRGRYVTVWKKVNGEWKVAYDTPAPSLRRPPAEAEQEALKAHDEWEEAFRKKDRAALERVLADDYITHNSNGTTNDKAGEIAEVMSADTRWTGSTSSNLKARLYGDVAVITGTLALTGSAKSYVPGPRLFTEVMVRRDGRWQAVRWQGTLIK